MLARFTACVRYHLRGSVLETTERRGAPAERQRSAGEATMKQRRNAYPPSVPIVD
ncbi:hypothetical protein ACFQO4_11995 [Saliphagus sp. GCM10025334]